MSVGTKSTISIPEKRCEKLILPRMRKMAEKEKAELLSALEKTRNRSKSQQSMSSQARHLRFLITLKTKIFCLKVQKCPWND